MQTHNTTIEQQTKKNYTQKLSTKMFLGSMVKWRMIPYFQNVKWHCIPDKTSNEFLLALKVDDGGIRAST